MTFLEYQLFETAKLLKLDNVIEITSRTYLLGTGQRVGKNPATERSIYNNKPEYFINDSIISPNKMTQSYQQILIKFSINVNGQGVDD